MLKNCSHSKFAIPRNAFPFPGTTKKLLWYLMPSLITMTLHIPMCGILKLFYAQYTIYLLMDLFNSFMFICRRSILYILIGIKLPSLPVSILNLHVSVFCLLFSTTWLLLIWCFGKWKICAFPMSNSCVTTSLSSVSWHRLWTALHPLSAFGTHLLWPLHIHLEWLSFLHLEELLS